jgi:phospholipid N-methyltransferase
MFKPKEARRRLKRYRKKGLDKIERAMLDSIPTDAVKGARVLEIGGGIGTIQAELLQAGANSGEIIELLSTYEPYARELAREKRVDDRSTFRVVDVLDHPETVSHGDIVVLDRVVCCSPDGVQLVGTAARLADRMLLVVHPSDRWFIRAGGSLMNFVFGILGWSFRIFLHPKDALYAAAESEGLVVSDTGRVIAWEFVTFRRGAERNSLASSQ